MKQLFLFSLSLVVLISLVGCLSSSAETRRMVRYRPESERSPWLWKNTSDEATSIAGSNLGTGNSTSQRSDVDETQARLLKRGDKVSISLRDIPVPQEIRDIIDNLGCVNLPLVGTLKIEGTTTSEAENIIEDAYIRGGYYKKINVIVVGGEEEYFISGEVKREGKYSISPGLTLLGALAESGGYTDYADKTEVTIKRAGVNLTFNAKKIAAGKDNDPPIKAGDIIQVPKRII